MTNPVIENVRRSLGHSSSSLEGSRPEIYPPRPAQPVEKESEQFLQEIERLQGTGKLLNTTDVSDSLKAFVSDQKIRRATLWNTPYMKELNVAVQLQALGVEVVSPIADKTQLAQCDLGITEADFLLAQTGTVVLRSSPDKPRAVSLLPPTHLVIASPQAFRPDLHQVFTEIKHDPYVVFVTGASRTSDIELVSTLGVHGPRYLVVWLVQP